MPISEATLHWEHWRARRRRRRQLQAWGVSLGVTVLVAAVALWGGFPRVFNVGEKGEAIAVKLGNPEGEDLPLKVSALPDPAMQAVMSAQRDTALTTVEETRASEPGPAPAPAPAKPQSASKPAPAQPTPAKPAPAPAVPAPTTPVVTEKVIRGSEKGNSSELILKPQGEKISQNAYWPVYLFMPLPLKVDAALLARIQGTNLYSVEERRALLLQFYAKAGASLTLSSDPGLALRPALWDILEGAGYDVANADYKRNPLQPVVIAFRIGVPKSAADNPELLDVKLEQSSGNAAVDEAVLYAFQKSSFANGTGVVADGRYTYDFTAKK